MPKNVNEAWLDGYKVVSIVHPDTYPRARSNKLADVYYSCTPMADVVEYNVGVTATPHIGGGPLAIFGDLGSAGEFVADQTSIREFLRIYKCKYLGSECACLWRSEDRGVYRYTRVYRYTSVPFGTKFADAVILTEWIKRSGDEEKDECREA